MAYRIQKVSPSALAATECCPRFRPNGAENQAAIDGTQMHDFAEQLVSIPRSQWDSWIASRPASPDMKNMLTTIAEELRLTIPEDLAVYPEFRLRMRGGRPRKTALRPGYYPECELDRGGGRHGYIDLLAVTPAGIVYIIDYKSNRVEKDFSLQLGAYACDVNRLAPAHTAFVCKIIAPRLDAEANVELAVGPDEIDAFNRRIAAIEERADRSANDDSIPGVPCASCEYCHWNGMCKYQAAAAQTVVESVMENRVVVSPKLQKTTVIPALAALVGPGGPYEGEALTTSTFTAPATVKQRGLRRACLKFLEVLIDEAKKDDTRWASTVPPAELKTAVPGFTISSAKGRGSIDPANAGDVQDVLKSYFSLSPSDVALVSRIDVKLLTESLVAERGYTEKRAKDEIGRCLEPFMRYGAPTVRWSQKPVSTGEY